MQNSLFRFLFAFCAMFALTLSAQTQINWTELLKNPSLSDVDTTYRAQSGSRIARIRFAAMTIDTFSKWNMSVPRAIKLSNTIVDVKCSNITKAELRNLLLIPILFPIEIDGFRLSLEGVKNTAVFRSEKAVLDKNRTLRLSGKVILSTAKGNLSLGNNATLTLQEQDRMIFVEYQSNKKCALRF